jgi:hypothetical protein
VRVARWISSDIDFQAFNNVMVALDNDKGSLADMARYIGKFKSDIDSFEEEQILQKFSVLANNNETLMRSFKDTILYKYMATQKVRVLGISLMII